MNIDNNNQGHTVTEDRCRKCGAPKFQKSVSHAVHDGPFLGTGGGKVEHSLAVWCPNCDLEPSSRGESIDDPLGDWGRRIVPKEEKRATH